jgi:hypothetical protein
MAAIVPRANPTVPQINSLAPVRNNTQVQAPTGMAAAVGSVVGGAMDVVQKHKEQGDLTALMQARRELSDHELALFDPANTTGVYSFKGKDALEAGSKVGADFDTKAGEIAGRLTPDQRARFDQIALASRESILGRVQNYAGGEYRQWEAADRKASLSSVVATGVTAALDGDEATGTARLAEALHMQQLSDLADGQSEAVQRVNAQAMTSGYHMQVLASLVDRDYATAEDYLSQHRNALLPEDRIKVEGVLRPIADDGEADTLATAIVNGGQVSTGHDGNIAARSANDPVSVQKDFRGLADTHGFDISSTKRPVLAIGAGARSQHPKGTAADFSVQGKTKAEGDALIADLKRHGFEVIDERDGKTGTGPHIHAELPPDAKRGGEPVAYAAATTLGEALERTKAITDPRKRRAVEQHVRSQWSVMEADRTDRERVALEGMRAKIGADDGSAPLRKVLGADYAEAEKQGWLGTLNAEMDAKRTGTLVKTNPITYDRFARLRVTDPVEFAKPATKLAIEKAAGELDTGDLARLQGDWADANDPKKREAALNQRKIEAGLVKEGLATLGYTGSGDKEKAAAFGLAIAQARQVFRDTNKGVYPTPEQDRALVGSVTRRFLNDGDTAKERAESYSRFSLKLTSDERDRARRGLIGMGVAAPSESQIIEAASVLLNRGNQ